MDSTTIESDQLVIGPEGQIEGKKCVDCLELKPFDFFQKTPKGGYAKDCKACRRLKYEQGIQRKKETGPVTKEWVVQEARRLYDSPFMKLPDKIKILDTISRNITGDQKGATDDAKVIRDLIASKKKLKAMGR